MSFGLSKEKLIFFLGKHQLNNLFKYIKSKKMILSVKINTLIIFIEFGFNKINYRVILYYLCD